MPEMLLRKRLAVPIGAVKTQSLERGFEKEDFEEEL